MDYINWFLNVEPTLHTWDKSHLFLICNSFYTFWIWLAIILLRISASIVYVKSIKNKKNKDFYFTFTYSFSRGSPGGSVVKNPPAGFDPWVSLEKEMATHSSILAWEIPWALGSYGPWGCKRARHDLVTKQLHNIPSPIPSLSLCISRFPACIIFLLAKESF